MCCWKHSKTSVFRKAQLSKNTVSKKTLFRPCQKTPFQKKVSFWFWAISAETTIFIVFPGLLCFGPQKILAITDSVHENTRFSPFLTQIVSGNVCKKSIFHFCPCLDNHLKNTYFYRVLGPFPFSFFFFLFLCLQHKKKTKTKNAIFFSNTSFLTSR